MKKRIIAVAMAATMLLVTGCSDKKSSGDKSADSNTTTQVENNNSDGNESEIDKEDDNMSIMDATDPSWAEHAVFYEIFVRSFCDGNGDGIGDFKGIADKVDYLKELGVDAVWLMPMMESTTYHGYDVVDYYMTNPDFGTMEDFQNMLDVLHDNDIRVIIDFVVNHTSSSNEWFKQALADEDSKYREYYFIYNDYPEGMKEIRKNSDTGLYYYGHYDGIMPDLNYSNQNVRDEIKEVAGFWLDKGVDGFRLDGAKEIDVDQSITHSWWKEFTEYVSEKNPAAFIVGENWNNSPNTIAPFYSDMNSSFNFPLASAVKDMANGVMRDYVTELVDARQKYKEATEAEDSANNYMIDSTMINNHDMDRVASVLKETNRQKLAAALLMTLPGTPFIYYGDELGELGIASDINKREPFEWYKSGQGQGQVDFKKAAGKDPSYMVADDGISYEEECDSQDSLLNYYKKLIKIRKENPMLFDGDYESFGKSDSLYAYSVKEDSNEERLLIIHNQSGDDKSFTINADVTDLITGNNFEKGTSVTIPSCNTMIFKYTTQEVPLNSEEFFSENEGEYSTTFNITLPENTPENEDVYMVGTFNDWNECDDRYVVERTSKTTATITISCIANASIEYKFTRGSWSAREQAADHTDMIGKDKKQNRLFRFEEDGAVEDVIIESWSDIRE